MLNSIMPMVNTYTALALLLLPVFAKTSKGGGREDLSPLIRKFLFLFLIGSVIYWTALVALDEVLVRVVYGQQYSDYTSLLWILGIVPIFTGVSAIIGSALRALERPDLVFWAQMLSSVTALAFGSWWIKSYGVNGAGSAMLLSYIVIAIAMASFYLWKTQD
jgi:O-antigen/teichoic acid export membrane protein